MTDPVTVSSSPYQVANLNTFNPKTSLHFADTYIFREKNTKKRFGELFVVIQIDNATRTSPQVADAIATILQNEYYRGKPSETAKNFEDALHKTNEILSDLAARGEIHWIGKLHAAVVVIRDKEIHVSATGRAKVFLVRQNELAEISLGLYDSGRAASPLKTFENQASGDLLSHDVLFLTTPGIPEQITFQSLRQLLQKKSPREITDQIITQTGRDAGSVNAAVVIKYGVAAQTGKIGGQPTTAGTIQPTAKKSDAAALAPQDPDQDSVFSETTTGPDPLLTTSPPVTAPRDPNTSGQPTNAGSSRALSGKKNLFNQIKSAFTHLGKSRRKTKKGTSTHRDASSKSIQPGSRSAVNLSGTSGTSAKNNKAPTKKGFRQTLLAAFKNISLKTKVIGSLIVLVLFIFVVSIFVFTGSRKVKQDRQIIVNSFNEAKGLEEQAAAAIIFKDFTGASDLLKQAQDKLKEIGSDKTLSQQIGDLNQAINADLTKLDGAVNIPSPKTLAAFVDAEPTGLQLAKGAILLWDKKGEIAQVDLTTSEITQLATLDQDQGTPLLGATNDQNDLIILSSQNKLLKEQNSQVKTLTVSGTFKPKRAQALATYGNRLYLLDRGANKIYRHQQTLAGFTQGESWINDETSVKNGVDFSIDGAIWVLLEDGTVIKMLSGAKEKFTLGSLVDPLENPTKIVTAEDTNFLFILEPTKHRLVQFDKKSGEFVKQYKSDKFDDLKDFTIIEKGQTGYLLNGNKVFEIKLQS